MKNEDLSIIQDYTDLFSFIKQGHIVKYVHMVRPQVYEEILDQHSYYPYRMECEILEQKADYICNNLRNVAQALEIGPGSGKPIVFKTVPLLNSLMKYSNLSSYVALDSNVDYAQNACEIIRGYFKTLKVEGVKFDFLSSSANEISLVNLDKRQKLLFSFGQTIFGNNNDFTITLFLQNLGNLLNKGDYLLFGTDTNQDAIALEKAYNTPLVHELLLNTMYYLKEFCQLTDFQPDKFDLVYKWDKGAQAIEFFLKATLSQKITLGKQAIFIKAGQKYNILTSRKLSILKIEEYLKKENLKIKEIITLDDFGENKFSLVLAQKQ